MSCLVAAPRVPGPRATPMRPSRPPDRFLTTEGARRSWTRPGGTVGQAPTPDSSCALCRNRQWPATIAGLGGRARLSVRPRCGPIWSCCIRVAPAAWCAPCPVAADSGSSTCCPVWTCAGHRKWLREPRSYGHLTVSRRRPHEESGLAAQDLKAAAEQSHLILYRAGLAAFHQSLEQLCFRRFPLPGQLGANGVDQLIDDLGNLPLRNKHVSSTERPAPVCCIGPKDSVDPIRDRVGVRHRIQTSCRH